MSKEICHVCKKEKKPYAVFLKGDIMSFLIHDQAREKGPICERCNTYFSVTGEFKDATDQEQEVAIDAIRFAHKMLKWWEKDGKMDIGDVKDFYAMPDEEKNKRSWGGTVDIAKWYREEFKKEDVKGDKAE